MNPNGLLNQMCNIAMGIEKSPSEIRSDVEVNLNREVQSLTNLVSELKAVIHDQKIEIRVLRSLIK